MHRGRRGRSAADLQPVREVPGVPSANLRSLTVERIGTPARVAFLNPGSATEPFFGKLAALMSIAAAQLDIDLEVIDCHRQRSKMLEEGEALMARTQRPDYLVMGNPEGVAVDLLPGVTEAGIKVMLINEGIMSYDYKKVGRPRQRLANWLGQLQPDDQQAGHLLAEHLLEAAAHRGRFASDGTIHLGGLAGDYSPSSNFRVVGLNRALKARQDVTLNAVHLGEWDRDRARELTAAMLKLFPQTSVVWAASDLMAAGAIEAIAAAGMEPGRDILVGGVDWAPQAYDGIRDGSLTASAGGHFMEGAWALIMLYDHHFGRDFQNTLVQSNFVVLTAENLSEYSMLFDKSRWEDADFAKLSKVKNKTIDSYTFGPRAPFYSTS